jgi:hypothetical protein
MTRCAGSGIGWLLGERSTVAAVRRHRPVRMVAYRVSMTVTRLRLAEAARERAYACSAGGTHHRPATPSGRREDRDSRVGRAIPGR